MKTRPNTLMMHHYTRKCTTQHLDHLDHYKHIHVLTLMHVQNIT